MNNVVGKMLVILQLVFSILFMCFAGAVYTFSGQWREKALEEEKKAANFTQQLTEEKQSNVQNLEEINKQLVAATEERDKLRSDLQESLIRTQTSTDLLEEVRQERDKAIAEIEVANDEAASRLAESTELRAEVQAQRNRINELIKINRQREDENLDLSGLVAAAREREGQNIQEIGRLTDLARQNGIDPRQAVVGPVPKEIEKVEGLVTATHRSRDRSQEYVEVTIGSDDKVFKDQILTVYGPGKYKADIRVYEVNPDTAVGIVVEDTRNGSIERGDHVTTKL
ncbi:MAG: hypothetical protein R3C19_08465 [Planctomycetaceae bacterium]